MVYRGFKGHPRVKLKVRWLSIKIQNMVLHKNIILITEEVLWDYVTEKGKDPRNGRGKLSVFLKCLRAVKIWKEMRTNEIPFL